MLRLLRSTALLSSRNNLTSDAKVLYNASSYTFGHRKKHFKTTEELIAERQRQHYNKREASKVIMEQTFFPDHSKAKVQEFIQEKKEQLANEGQDPGSEKLQLTRDDVKYIEQISSQGTNEEAKAQKSYFFPETREEMSKLIAATDINDKLLKFYMKYHRLSGKQQIIELLEKLEENLAKQEEVEDREIDRYKRKVSRMKEINKNIEIPFNAVFLTKEQILKHAGFQFLMNGINFKASKKVYQPYTVLELYHSILKFDSRAGEFIDPNVLKTFDDEMNQHSIFTIGRLINLLQHYKALNLKKEEARAILEKAAGALNQKDFSEITRAEVLAILVPLKKIGLPFDDEVTFRLEPYILKYLSQFDADKLVDIFLTYLRFRKGSIQFMQLLVATLAVNLDKISVPYIKTIMTLSYNDFARRRDLDFEDLRRAATKELMRNFTEWNFSNDEILQIMKAMIKDGVADENNYEMLTVEFMKRLRGFDSNAFMEMYYDFAVADLNSKTLAHGCNHKLISTFEEFRGVREQKVVGLLETSEEAVPGTVESSASKKHRYNSNKYERKYANDFKLALKTAWAYTFFIVKHKEWKLVDLDLWNLCIKELNNMIKKMKSFSSLIEFSRNEMELAHQINLFSIVHAKNSNQLDMKELKAANLKYKDQLHSYPLPFTVTLFWLERNYFMKKYKSAVTKYIETENYVYEAVLENKAEGSKTNLFINDSSDFLGHYDPAKVRDKSYLKMRKHYLDTMKVPFVEIGYDQFLRNLPSTKSLDKGYIEHALSKYITLPDVSDPVDETEDEKLMNIWEKIQAMREEIQETALTFEDLRNLNKLAGRSGEINQGRQRESEELEESEGDDVYKDSDSDTEEKEQK